MTLVVNHTMQQADVLEEENTSFGSVKSTEELTIITKTQFNHANAMPEDLKREKQKNAPDMSQLFEDSLKEKGEYDPQKIQWVDADKVEVSGLPGMALQNFVLQAEALGKNVTYTKQTIIKISN